MTTSEKLKAILKMKPNEGQDVLAHVWGKHRTTVSKKLNGKVAISIDELIKTLEYWKIELDEFRQADTDAQLRKLANVDKCKRDQWNWIPVFDESQIANRTWIDLEFPREAIATRAGKAVTKDPDAFYFMAAGEHMVGHAPNGTTLREGYLLLVEPNTAKESGCLVLCYLEGQASVKIWHDNDGIITLQSLDPKIAPVIIIDPDHKKSLVVYRITRFITNRL